MAIERVGRSRGRYGCPDLNVFCDDAQLRDGEQTLLNPVVLFETLSPRSADYDPYTKLEYCCALPSVQTHVIIDPYDCQADLRFRTEAPWRRQACSVMDAVVPFEVFGCQSPLAEVYRGVALADA